MRAELKNILTKIDSIKSVLDGYRPFSDYVVKQLRDYYRSIIYEDMKSLTRLQKALSNDIVISS